MRCSNKCEFPFFVEEKVFNQLKLFRLRNESDKMRVDIEELKKKGEQAIKDIAGLKVRKSNNQQRG